MIVDWNIGYAPSPERGTISEKDDDDSSEVAHMTISVRAVYERGVLRPVRPLPFDEGETVDLTIGKPEPPRLPPCDDQVVSRLQAATTIADWVEATKLLPPDDGGYDIVKALNDNRIWSGERSLIPNESPPQ